MRIGVIVNSRARKNQQYPDRAARLRQLVGHTGEVCTTRHVSELGPVIDRMLRSGVDVWVSDGGDGTFHWLLNGLAQAGALAHNPVLVPSNGGTIDFVAKRAGVRGAPETVLERLVAAVRSGAPLATTALGTLELHGRSEGAWGFTRLGFAAALGGVGQKFFSAYYDEPTQGAFSALRVIAKAATGIVSSLPGLRRLPVVPESYRTLGRRLTEGTRARVSADGRVFDLDRLQGLHAGSIDANLGAVRLFPFAREPGQLHLVVGAMTPLEATWKWAFLAAGRPAPGPRWHEFAGHELSIEAYANEPLDPVIDGELYHGFEALKLSVGPRVTLAAP